MGIETILATVVPAFFPVIGDAFKMLISKLTGTPMGEPKDFKDFLAMEQLKIDKLKALADLDRVVGDISRWVADLRASFRYIFVGVIILAAIVYNFLPPGYRDPQGLAFFNQLAGSATFFIIGDRVYLGLKSLK